MSILWQRYADLAYWNEVTLLQHYEELVGGANEQIVDQDWGVSELVVGTNGHDGGANEQNVVQDDVDGVSPMN